jgi:glycosyltransferase involved in cell wall biosynthesis
MAEASVCIPAYNGARFIEGAIRSVLDQSFKDFELVIVDDCSKDETGAIIESFGGDPRLRHFTNPVRRGMVGNWNRCLELSEGKYICVFHQDDVMAPENLERKIESLKGNPRVGLVYSKVDQIDADGHAVEGYKFWTEQSPDEDFVRDGLRYFAELIASENLICCPSVIARRECYERLGPFDSRLPFTADWEMWLRIAAFYDIAYLAEPLVKYRWHADNETNNFVTSVRGLEQVYAAKRIVLEKFPRRIPEAKELKASIAREYGTVALHQVYHHYHRQQFDRARQYLLFVLKVQPSLLKNMSDIRLSAQLLLGAQGTELVRKTKRLFAKSTVERR